MTCFGLFLALVTTLLIMYTATAATRKRTAQRNRLYRELASRFSGVFVGGSWVSYPSTRFQYGDIKVVVEPLIGESKDSIGECHVRMPWPAVNISCVIYSRDSESQHIVGWRQREVRFESGPLTHDFTITTNQEAQTRTCLSEQVRWEIERLLHTSETKSIRILISRGQLLFQRHGNTRSVESTEGFIRQCLRVFDQVRLSSTQGVAFLNQDAAASVGPVNCPICGDAAGDDLVFCRRCKTIHHAECWQYNGRCATYGCGELVFARPSQAELTRTDDQPSK